MVISSHSKIKGQQRVWVLFRQKVLQDIKYKGKKVGFISPKSRYKPFCTAYLQVKQEPTFEHPSDWDNKLLSHQTETVQEMKDWLNGNIDTILSENELKYD